MAGLSPELLGALAAGAVALVALGLLAAAVARWRASRAAVRSWQEVTAAARALVGAGDRDAAASAIVEQARRLARADWAWLWWIEAGRLRPAGSAGAPEAPRLSPSGDALQRLDAGPLPIADLSPAQPGLAGEALLLRPAGAARAVLAVGWRQPPARAAARLGGLRLLVPWATDALAQAEARAALVESLRRETILRRAAGRLAGVDDSDAVHEVVLEAVRDGLGAVACLAERSSGRLVAGGSTPAAVRADGAAARHPSTQSAPLGHGLVAVAERASPFSEDEVVWLASLANAASAALERAEQKAALEEAARRLAAVIEELPAPAALWDAEGALVLANRAHRRLDLPERLPEGGAGASESELVWGDPPRTFLVSRGQVAGKRYVLVQYQDITRERAALRAKDDLISVVGHELRTPLTSIRGYSQMMGRQLGVVQEQIDQLNRLIGDLIEGGREGVAEMRREPIDLAVLARAAADRFRGAHGERPLRLELAPVPPLEGDAMRLGQVIDNLLTNAAKYSPAETPIDLSVRAEAGQVVLAVRDRGVGIAREHMGQLFERFYRVPGQHTAERGGLGLGLAIVRDLVEAHGGQIGVESDGEGSGSLFWVRLPAATAEPVG